MQHLIEFDNSISQIISGIPSDLPAEQTYLITIICLYIFIYNYSNIIVHILLNNHHFISGKLARY